MNKDNPFDIYTYWYDLWMKQSKEFFESANNNLKNMFDQEKESYLNPEEHIKQIQEWLETLKNQWQFIQLNEQQKAYETYWKMMNKMCAEASDMMLSEWMKKTREHQPIKNIHELYELWLNCCNEIYTKAMHSKSYQEAYGEFMNAALKFWKSATPR